MVVPANHDGDGKINNAIWRPSIKVWMRQENQGARRQTNRN